MKQRYTALDIKIIARELSEALVHLRLSNIYDAPPHSYLLKFATPDARQSLVVKPGFLCYLTKFTCETASSPSAFVARLRTLLKSKRITNVRQIGSDRIIEIQIQEGKYNLYLEFFSLGNIILTDATSTILAILRPVPEGTRQEQQQVGMPYKLENRHNYDQQPSYSLELLRQALKEWSQKDEAPLGNKKQRAKRSGDSALLRALTTTFNEFPAVLISHALHTNAFATSLSIESILADDGLLENLFASVKVAEQVVNDMSSTEARPGYIICRSAPTQAHSQGANSHQGSPEPKYDSFESFLPAHVCEDAQVTNIEFPSLNLAVDQYLSITEARRLEDRLKEKEKIAEKRLANAKLEHEKRLGGLQEAQELHIRKAQAIEDHLEEVENAIAAVNSLLAQAMDWQNIEALIASESKRGNPVATIIKTPLKLDENKITLLLKPNGEEDSSEEESGGEFEDDSEEEEITTRTTAKRVCQSLQIDVDLSLSPWANARQYYDQKKVAAVKEQRTAQSSTKVLRNTERKVKTDLQKSLRLEKELIKVKRQPWWFEKFYYFISSEDYLILMGKDGLQSDIIYREHLRKGDVFVHADTAGAIPAIIKNKPSKRGQPIPPATLTQAGDMVGATSAAWDAKAVMPAWWVAADQVTKIDAHGQVMQAGQFYVRGEKIFTPPARLLLGFGILFHVTAECKSRHTKNRIAEDVSVDNILANDEGAKVLDRVDCTNAGPELAHIKGSPQAEQHTNLPADQTTDDSEEISTADQHANITAEQITDDTEENSTAEHVIKDKSHESKVTAVDANDTEDVNSVETSPAVVCKAGNGKQMTKPINDTSTPMHKHIPEDSKAKAGQASKSSARQVRGKKGKLLKEKRKYADQDEEDRVLAAKLLGTQIHNKVTEATVIEKAKDASNGLLRQQQQEQQNRSQQAAYLEKTKAFEDQRLQLLSTPDSLSTSPSLSDLDYFIGYPTPGDELLGALIICGPWDGIGSRCRWREKIQPGTLKKGRAVKDILDKWNHTLLEIEKIHKPEPCDADEGPSLQDTHLREHELIRSIKAIEAVSVVPVSKLRLVMSNARGGKPGGKRPNEKKRSKKK